MAITLKTEEEDRLEVLIHVERKGSNGQQQQQQQIREEMQQTAQQEALERERLVEIEREHNDMLYAQQLAEELDWEDNERQMQQMHQQSLRSRIAGGYISAHMAGPHGDMEADVDSDGNESPAISSSASNHSLIGERCQLRREGRHCRLERHSQGLTGLSTVVKLNKAKTFTGAFYKFDHVIVFHTTLGPGLELFPYLSIQEDELIVMFRAPIAVLKKIADKSDFKMLLDPAVLEMILTAEMPMRNEMSLYIAHKGHSHPFVRN
eukprot:gene25762-32251_t